MSSITVRSVLMAFVRANNGGETLVDFTSEFRELDDLLEDNNIGPLQDWMGIEFIGNDETPITLPATNTSGTYRETGAVYIHVIGVAKLGGADTILQRADALRKKLRGQRLGTVIIETVTPANFQGGATLQFDSGWMSASFICSYEFDENL